MNTAELAAMPTPAPDVPHVGSMMSQPVLTVEVGESLWDAWQLLFVSGLRHLVVIDADGQPLGCLADRSILADLPATREHLSSRKVSDVLARVPLVTVRPSESPVHAAHLMSLHSIEALPVLDDSGRLAGIVTETDLVHWLGR